MRRPSLLLELIILALICASPGVVCAAQSEAATLTGIVTDGQSGAPLMGATVRSNAKAATTDAKGVFTLTDVATGTQTLSITADGHQSVDKTIEIHAGKNTVAGIRLEAASAVELSDVVVTDPTSGALSKFDDKAAADALSDAVYDPAVKQPSAQTGSDVVKEVAGVAVSKGANGTSSVSVRGIDQRMLRITVDGQRQGGSGNPLDNIPAEIVQSLEVTKTFTPDMEGDAVGGVINVNTGGTVMKEGYEQGRHQVSYNTLASRPSTRNSLTIGRPFEGGEGAASVLGTASFDDQYSTRERISTLREWTSQLSPGPGSYAGQYVPVLTLPLIESTEEHRQRTGLVLNSDARFGDLALYWRSNFGRDRANRDRNLNDTDSSIGVPLALTPQSGTFANVPLSRRNQEQLAQRDALNASFGGKSKLGGMDIDSVLAYGRTQEQEPHTLETGFLSARTYQVSYNLVPHPYAPEFEYIDETDSGDVRSASAPDNYRLSYLNVTQSDVDEDDGSFKFNLKTNSNADRYLKFGGKIQRRTRTADVDREVYDAGSVARTMSGLVSESSLSLDTRDYSIGPIPDAGGVRRLLVSDPSALSTNLTRTAINSETGDYDVKEELWAAYAMGKIRFGRWTLLGGARFEGTRVTSSANQMLLDDTGQLVGFESMDAHNDYSEFLPGVHLRFEPRSGLIYRASITRSMSRPSSADIAPYRTLSFVDRRSRIGAPDLKPYLATNFDASLDAYDARYGLLSFAVFYKKIAHFITDAQYPVEIGNLGTFIEFKRVNGEAARTMGLELNWQGPQWTLPLNLGRATLEANYSFNDGKAHHPTRPNESFPLPRQVDHQGSIKLHDERGPASFDASVSYRSGWWEDLIAPGFDNYITAAWDAELSTAYKFSKAVTVTFGASNLLDRPTRHYAGDPSRMNDWQRNGVELSLRAQWKL